MSRIFLDTNFFIYLVEGTGPNVVRARQLRDKFSLRRDWILTSVMTLGEVLVNPIKQNNLLLSNQYRRIFNSRGIEVLPFIEAAAERFARLRGYPGIKQADAIQLATAATAGCDLFLTNDERLHGLTVPGIQFITSFDRAPI